MRGSAVNQPTAGSEDLVPLLKYRNGEGVLHLSSIFGIEVGALIVVSSLFCTIGQCHVGLNRGDNYQVVVEFFNQRACGCHMPRVFADEAGFWRWFGPRGTLSRVVSGLLAEMTFPVLQGTRVSLSRLLPSCMVPPFDFALR